MQQQAYPKPNASYHQPPALEDFEITRDELERLFQVVAFAFNLSIPLSPRDANEASGLIKWLMQQHAKDGYERLRNRLLGFRVFWDTKKTSNGQALSLPHPSTVMTGSHYNDFRDYCIESYRGRLPKIPQEWIDRIEQTTPEISEGFSVLANEVSREGIEWYWEPRIAIGKLTLIEGDPGVGKSWLLCAFATATSLGYGLPGMPKTDPAMTLMFTAEDGLGDTMRPRLEDMGAELRLIALSDEPITFDTPGLLRIEAEIIQRKPRLVTIDPIVAYIGAGVDMNRGNQTRPVFQALAAIAARQRCVILGVRHLSKSGKDKAIYRGIGTIDQTAAVRSVLLAGEDPDDKNKRAIAHIKNNIGPKADPLGFEIRDGRFYWLESTTLTASRMLAPASSDSEKGALADAEDFLRDYLADGPKNSNEVIAEAEGGGISKQKLFRARQNMGIKAKRSGFGRGGQWKWSLPDQNEQPDAPKQRQE